MDPVRFGIIGCGSAALPVCEAIHGSGVAKLAAACDIKEDLAREIGERYRIPFTAEADEVLGNSNVDAVYIAVPHDLLAPIARRALGAGKHTLAEKPLALTLADADELTALADERRRALGVFYELRYSAPFAFARKLVRAGVVGRVNGVRIQTLIDKPAEYWQAGYTGRSIHPWRGQRARAGGGVVLMNSSHQLDAVWHITGLEVTSVSAEVGTLVAPVEVEDTASAALRFENGAIGNLFAGAHIPGAAEAERVELFGTEGQLQIGDPYCSGASRLYLRRGWQAFAPGQWHTLPCEVADCYRGAVADFARAVQRGAPAPVGGRDARRVLAIVLAMYRSAVEGRSIDLRSERHEDR